MKKEASCTLAVTLCKCATLAPKLNTMQLTLSGAVPPKLAAKQAVLRQV